MFEIRDHWLKQARQVVSPNFNARPDGCFPELIVLHNISLPPGKYGTGYVAQFFTNQLPVDDHPFFASIKDVKVSSHFFIDRQGQVTQFVDCDQRAWHAGVSSWQGRDNCNDFSIGIEMEGVDDAPYDDRQYAGLQQLIPALWRAYPSIAPDAITGHEHIAPGRKTDPGPAFDWARLHAALADAESPIDVVRGTP